MTDIVERLRGWSGQATPISSTDIYTMTQEAADEIERLRAERNDYQARVIPAETEVVRLEAQIMEAVRLARVSSMSADDIAAALSQPEGKAEAVAYRWRARPDGDWHYGKDKPSGFIPDEIEPLYAALQPSGQTHSEIIEECAKVAEAWDGKPCGPASGWTDDQRDYYDAGQLDASSSIVRAVRALAAQEKEKTQT